MDCILRKTQRFILYRSFIDADGNNIFYKIQNIWRPQILNNGRKEMATRYIDCYAESGDCETIAVYGTMEQMQNIKPAIVKESWDDYNKDRFL